MERKGRVMLRGEVKVGGGGGRNEVELAGKTGRMRDESCGGPSRGKGESVREVLKSVLSKNNEDGRTHQKPLALISVSPPPRAGIRKRTELVHLPTEGIWDYLGNPQLK